ncbi:formate--tetrahydrofolate ligase [Lentilactobacillus senioris DSM 24302 = JCM 17472]|uniref:Formate--tetrahydrofolate ligase n=1 Tax=Lentilactobacillus senioris DSM 24302 = JCM 17472 TaxID=1423802 RepID=A0A0R2CQJ7_9LACO|nr:formate--tetrahydrofolate ligase [Lentilactobacillus senioris]KRM93847.1 formate--tetrahydrofolate ligase [Lentilactobacillus senioris DSM 24302 = JCM 17472]
MKSDIEISQTTKMDPIFEVAQKLDINADSLEQYGNYKAKVSVPLDPQNVKSKLVLVTSINPTSAGEGKTTVSVGLGDALSLLGQRIALALREPSLGPVMGLKGGATGGGYSQVVPMEDINLHFTGDFHAITEAHDTLAALVDNHIQHGNQLNIDPRQIVWKRVLDVNDRELRQTVIGLGGKTSGVPRQDGFDITVASEIMAILCLASDLEDLKRRISKIIIGYTYDGEVVTVADLKVQGALTLLLKDAIKPNLVQTLEHTPAFIHGGPFANIAHGCNSILATQAGLTTADYTVTEAGFGSDLGGEKFMDIASPAIGKRPDVVVVVATIRALKLNGGQDAKELKHEDLEALKAGVVNLKRHVQNMQQFGQPVVVGINKFATDSDAEVNFLHQYVADELHVAIAEVDCFSEGGKGAVDLANLVIENSETAFVSQNIYDADDSLVEKLTKVTQKVYGGKNVELTAAAKKQLKQIEKLGYAHLPVCMAKTQYSFSDDPKLLGAPSGFIITVRELQIKAGAGFIVAITGNILTMPGLPSHPAALDMDISADGTITGLF